MSRLTDKQAAAVAARSGSVLVSAGAGTGKTSVLVERFAAAVVDDGVEVGAILAITFTEKAAAELKTRVRRRLVELGRTEEARATEGAWISTIHGFCARVLSTHALAAGIDPEFGVLDQVATERLAIDAFDRALTDFLGSGADEHRLELLAAYTPDRLADMVRTAYGHLRSRGEADPTLPEIAEPQAAGELAQLADAARAALSEIGDASSATVDKVRDQLGHCLRLLDAAGEGVLPDVTKLTAKGTAKVLQGPGCERYREAHQRYLDLRTSLKEYSDHGLLRDLLALHHEHYSRLKRERSGVDFDDLELLARDLLRGQDQIRAHYVERFTHVMVDEFQDTNPLQNDIVELLDRDNLFRVGDERQSIYRFRHADVGLFRRYRDAAVAAGGEHRITTNFRSRGELLDAVNRVFTGLWGDAFVPLLEAPGSRDAIVEGPCVELLVSDAGVGVWNERAEQAGEEPLFGASMADVPIWRAAEARLLARRIDELTSGDGGHSLSDVVLLLRATTHMSIYERALEERGIPTHVLGGRGYWGQQQVADLRAYLAVLANPLDELALHSVLVSPLVGASIDALVLLADCARRLPKGWHVWRVLEAVVDGPEDPPERIERLLASLAGEDRRRLQEFVVRFRAGRAAAPRLSLEALIDRAVTETGYDRAVLALSAGERRMANVRKLMRMARQFEAAEGRDLRAFIDFVAERDLISEREGQAPLDAEDLDAVRLMTIHRAKGLEFPVVVAADLGKRGRDDDSALRITEQGNVGIRLASLGARSQPSAQLKKIVEAERIEDEEEERRIFYVAFTRARERLICSGATDLEKLPEPKPLAEPMRWLWRELVPELPELGARATATTSYDGRPLEVRCEVLRPDALEELLPASDRSPTEPEVEPPDLAALTAPALAAVPVPPALAVSHLSYSSLESYRRCGYRFYLERSLRLPRPRAGDPHAAPKQAIEPDEGLSGRARGSIVHLLLEQLDFASPSPPAREEVTERIEAIGVPATEPDVDDILGLIDAFVASPLCLRLGRARNVSVELGFQFTLTPRDGGRSLLLNGFVDVYAEEDGRVLVVDYKSDRLEGREPVEIVDAAYATQRTVYALAALRGGAERVEVVYSLLERPDEPVATIFERDDVPALERRLLELAVGVIESRFEPTAEPHRGLCADCPGQPALCSWGPERTLAESRGEAA